MKIGSIILRDKPLLLAPMEDVTDFMFRSLCKEFGADLMYTEFVSSDALIRDIEKTKRKLKIEDYERPTAIQLYGKDPVAMREAAKIAEAAKPEFIDLNFGCPVKKIANKGAGAGLLKNIPLMLDITKEVVKAVNIPVTVKTRLGWDENSKNIVTIAEQLQDEGVDAITIHGRTRSQMYSGEADWTLIGEVKNNPRMQIPVIGNGDVNSPQKAADCFNRYGVDAVMIGRSSIGRPWIFKDIRQYLETGVAPEPISLEEHVEIIKRLLKNSVDSIGERRGILHTRRHLAVTFKGLKHFRQTKIKMLRSESIEEIFSILDSIKEDYKNSISPLYLHNNDEQ
ncbi:tRNA dihydrouridine synthase DusB [Marinilabiliaceae bacterium ANBcel2]|nr:tRNA dihydrouridine synthase DusB [Marinilabiliaceae bacterium ANBcel2]